MQLITANASTTSGEDFFRYLVGLPSRSAEEKAEAALRSAKIAAHTEIGAEEYARARREREALMRAGIYDREALNAPFGEAVERIKTRIAAQEEGTRANDER